MLGFSRGVLPRNVVPWLRSRVLESLAVGTFTIALAVGCGSGETLGPASRASSGSGGGIATNDAVTFSVDSALASDIDPSAPTTVGIVTWSIDLTSIVSAFIDFGLDTSYGMRAPVDLAESGHRTLLLGMKPERTYHFRITASDGHAAYSSDDYVIETGARTTLVPLGAFNVRNDTARERGFIVTSYYDGSVALNVPFILDADGEVVWWYARGPRGIARAALSKDGKNLWMVSPANSGQPVRRVSMDTLDEQTYPETAGSHDLTAVRGATMAYIDYSEQDCDSIVEIDPSGARTEVFESTGIVQRYAGRYGCHGNSIHYWPELDAYTWSDREQDVLLVDHGGSVLWRLSEIVSGGNAAWGGEQHGHQLVSDGIFIFANSGGAPDVSAIVEYSLDGEELFRYVGGHYSRNLGDVQRLPGGNLLVTYSNDSVIHELDAEKNVVLEINGAGSMFGYAAWTQALYPAD